MKKQITNKLAMIGLASGIMLATVACQPETPKSPTAPKSAHRELADNAMTTTPKMTEKDLMEKLSPEGKTIYQGLDAEGKALALKLANDSTYKDKNDAVKAAAKKMADKHEKAHGG